MLQAAIFDIDGTLVAPAQSVSADALGHRHARLGHLVQHRAANLGLGPLGR